MVMRFVPGQKLFLAAVVVFGASLLGFLALFYDQGMASSAKPGDNPIDADRAMGYLEDLCKIGPRQSGSAGMGAQQKLLRKHFEQLGAKVEMQRFDARHPLNGSRVQMANLLVHWHPEKQRRILFCAHYDTRPYPDQDRVNPRGTFVGANDGASGTALLMELAHHMPDLAGKYGVDFALFDAEEFVFSDRDKYFLGSEHFAREYLGGKVRYQAAVLVDMIGDAQLAIPKDRSSISWKDTRPVVNEIWHTARRLRVREFVNVVNNGILDDHIPLHNLGGIPCCDLIDFDYPHWHTQADTPDKCSGESLAKVGWVLHEWLSRLQRQRE